MFLGKDSHFHFEALRSLGSARYCGGDIQETLAILPKIKPGDFIGWYDGCSALARRVVASIDPDNLEIYNPVTICNVFFRVSHYHFVSEFFLHADWDNSRSHDAYDN
jgi:hypothetical protein